MSESLYAAADALPAVWAGALEVASDRLAHPAAHVENRPSGTHVDQKPIQPRTLQKKSASVAIVLASMTLV